MLWGEEKGGDEDEKQVLALEGITRLQKLVTYS